MSESERKTGGTIKFSLKDFAPHLTQEQLEAIGTGKPVPPSPDWSGYVGSEHVTVDGYVPEKVTCVMIFGVRERIKTAKKAVDQFVRQTYQNKQLVIINGTDTAILTHQHSEIKEIKVEPDMSLGAMRNLGIFHADGDWIKQWDDDDVYSPHLLAYMMAHRLPGTAILLSCQIRLRLALKNKEVEDSSAYIHFQQEGIPNTILCPKTVEHPYPDVSYGEDVAFWAANWASRTHVILNNHFPATTLSLAVYHGHNVLPLDKFMVDHHGPEFSGRFLMPQAEIDYIMETMPYFGLQPVVQYNYEAMTDEELQTQLEQQQQILSQIQEVIARKSNPLVPEPV